MKEKKAKKLGMLPAVMMSISAINSLMAPAAIAKPAAPDSSPGATPAVFRDRPQARYPVPEQLRQYTVVLARNTGYQLMVDDPCGDCPPEPEPHPCATISGSDDGWDDSDCW